MHSSHFTWRCEQDCFAKREFSTNYNRHWAYPLPSTMEQEYLKLMNQLVELQKENIELRKEMLRGHTNILQVMKPERPSIGLDITEGEWALFLDTWTRYKDMCRLEDPVRNELRATCTPETNRLLFKLVGPTRLNSASEEFLLLHQIRLIVVKGLHKEVRRRKFHSMAQNEGESITQNEGESITHYLDYEAKRNIAILMFNAQMSKHAGKKWIIRKIWLPDR